MRIAILDPAAGISGDMTLGALLGAGVPRQWLEGLPGRLGFEHVDVEVTQVERASLAATKVTFRIGGEVEGPGGAHGDDGHGMHVRELVERVERAPVSEWVRARAVRAFELIGEAEGRVHGVPAEQVHLHEVGAVDAILDIVGSIEGFEQLGVEQICHLPVAVGRGWVRAAHGELPVPAPATAHLLEGLEIARGGPVEGEATTPTGAALLRVLSSGPPPERWRLVETAWGAGTRNPASYPNALRLMLAEGAPEAGMIEVLTTDVDDLNPEYLEPVRRAVFAAGAVECLAWPTQGKKGRVSLRLEALAPPDRAEAVVRALFRHTTTAGVRRQVVSRITLARRHLEVELAGGDRVRVKVWEGPDGPRYKAEYDDVVALAERLDQPALQLARDAERRAEAIWTDGRTTDSRQGET